jgi:hypothetical protein
LPRVKRISGSKNFRSPPQKDFCNNICQQQTFGPNRTLWAIAQPTTLNLFNP